MKRKMKLTIGTSAKLNYFYQHSLSTVADDLDLELEVLLLSQDEVIPWRRLDGVLIPGGPDINPCYYLATVDRELKERIKDLDYLVKYTTAGRKRDALEHGLMMEYFHDHSLQDLPIFGICRGMQMLAVARGIPLYVDINHELGLRTSKLRLDKLEAVDKDSLLFKLIGEKKLLATKLQHQAIRWEYFKAHRERWPNVELTAFSHQHSLPEAIEYKDRPVLGIQFHPEMSLGKEMMSFFRWFLQKAMDRHRHYEHWQLMYA